MRNIPASTINFMKQEYGLESVLIVRVFWAGTQTYTDYSDKADETNGILGKVLDISTIDDVIGIDSGGNSTQVSVTLDDSDGTIKGIIDTVDTHKRRVQILQWFTSLPFHQAFPIFTGLINTPMEWSEGERTFKFSALNLVENLEVGFALDEGDFQGLPIVIAGKAFPMVFGRALMVPSLIIGAAPSGLLAKGLGLVYTGEFQDQLNKLTDSLNATRKLAKDQSTLYGAAVVTAPLYNDGEDDSGTDFYQEGLNPYQIAQGEINAGTGEFVIGAFQIGNQPDDYSTYVQYIQAADQHRGQELQYEAEIIKIQKQISDLRTKQSQLQNIASDPNMTIINVDPNNQGSLGFATLASLNYNFARPGNSLAPFHIEMNGTYFICNSPTNNSVLPLIAEENPPNLRPYDPYFALYHDSGIARNTNSTKTGVKFKWFDAGTRVRFLDVPVYYIACYGNSAVTGVWAKAKGAIVPVPATYYQITPWQFTNTDGNTAIAQVVTMNIALSSILDASGQNIYDSDDIWCDINGEIDGNFANIVTYLLTLFSTLEVDGMTFGQVGAQVINTPMNFVLFDRKPVLDLIKELAFQAKVAAWIDDRTVKLRFLSAEPTPVATITPADLVEDSLVITSTATEELVTKMVGRWKSNFDQQSDNLLTLRYNLANYGLHTEEVDYYAYNNGEAVQRSLAFWVVRKGTVWKRIQFKTFIEFLNVESHDPVRFSGFEAYFSCQDVTGMIEAATYNSSDMTISFEAWLPIRWGEPCQTPYAFPSDQITFFGLPNDPHFLTGNPFQNAKDSQSNFEQNYKQTFKNTAPQPPLGRTTNFNMQDSPIQLNPDTAIAYVPINPIRPPGIERANDKTTYDLKPLPAVTITEDTNTSADLGRIIEQKEDDPTLYKVTRLSNGQVIQARQQQIADGFKIAKGAVVYLVKHGSKWMMQHPVWSKETDDTGV